MYEIRRSCYSFSLFPCLQTVMKALKMIAKKQLLLFPFLIGSLMIGCESESLSSPSNLLATSTTLPDGNNSDAFNAGRRDAYPVLSASNNAYPALSGSSSEPASSGYPAPDREYDESKRFQIERPVSSGTQSVSGIGPANVSIQIISISNVGETLGIGVIGENGVFNISLSRSLEKTETIAIMLSDESQRSQFLDAPGATDIPLLGFILDMASTNEP